MNVFGLAVFELNVSGLYFRLPYLAKPLSSQRESGFTYRVLTCDNDESVFCALLRLAEELVSELVFSKLLFFI